MECAGCALLRTCWGGVSEFMVSSRPHYTLYEARMLIDDRGTAERVLELVQKTLEPSSKL